MDFCRATICGFAEDFKFAVNLSYSLLHRVLYKKSTTNLSWWSLGVMTDREQCMWYRRAEKAFLSSVLSAR